MPVVDSSQAMSRPAISWVAATAAKRSATPTTTSRDHPEHRAAVGDDEQEGDDQGGRDEQAEVPHRRRPRRGPPRPQPVRSPVRSPRRVQSSAASARSVFTSALTSRSLLPGGDSDDRERRCAVLRGLDLAARGVEVAARRAFQPGEVPAVQLAPGRR